MYLAVRYQTQVILNFKYQSNDLKIFYISWSVELYFYSVSHLRNSFFKGPKMSDNQYVDKKKISSIITKPHHLTYNL